MSSLPPYNRTDAELALHLVPEAGLDAAVTRLAPAAVVAAADAEADPEALLARRGMVVVAGDIEALGRLCRHLLGADPGRPPIRVPEDGAIELRVAEGRVRLRALNRGATWDSQAFTHP
jgi:hypothetical protein